MKALWMIGGAVVGGRVLGARGLLVGAGLGYGLAVLFEAESRGEEALPAAGQEERAGHEVRYPEEAVIDTMEQAESEPAARGAEMEDIFREVSGEEPEE